MRGISTSEELPGVSARFKSAPLLRASHPPACAVWTVCPDYERARPFGVPWSTRMSTGGDGVAAETLGYEGENRRHLLARDIELPDDLVNAQILEVLSMTE